MSRFRIVGMDWFDVVVHVGVTFMVCVAAGSLFPGTSADLVVSGIVGGSLLWLGIRRKQALAELGEVPADPQRLEDLEARVAELDQVHARVAELEERLDFAERMLGQAREQERIGRP